LGHGRKTNKKTNKQLNCLLYAILKSRILKSAGKKSSQIRNKNDMIVARSKKKLFGTHLDAGIHPRAPHGTDWQIFLQFNLSFFTLNL
jgi:hypothetical protein